MFGALNSFLGMRPVSEQDIKMSMSTPKKENMKRKASKTNETAYKKRSPQQGRVPLRIPIKQESSSPALTAPMSDDEDMLFNRMHSAVHPQHVRHAVETKQQPGRKLMMRQPTLTGNLEKDDMMVDYDHDYHTDLIGDDLDALPVNLDQYKVAIGDDALPENKRVIRAKGYLGGQRKGRKSARKSRRTARKQVRKSRRNVRKQARKSRRTARKQQRKSRRR